MGVIAQWNDQIDYDIFTFHTTMCEYHREG